MATPPYVRLVGPPLITPEQLAALVGRTPTYIMKLRKRGGGPAYITVPDGSVRHPLLAVERWLNGQSAPTAVEIDAAATRPPFPAAQAPDGRVLAAAPVRAGA